MHTYYAAVNTVKSLARVHGQISTESVVEDIPEKCADDQENEQREQHPFSRTFVLVFQNRSDVTTFVRSLEERIRDTSLLRPAPMGRSHGLSWRSRSRVSGDCCLGGEARNGSSPQIMNTAIETANHTCQDAKVIIYLCIYAKSVTQGGPAATERGPDLL